jgi:hypothetical protein
MCSFPELIRFNVKLRIVFPMNKVSLSRLSENVSFQQHALTHSSDFLKASNSLGILNNAHYQIT